jgi:hypothetical protein
MRRRRAQPAPREAVLALVVAHASLESAVMASRRGHHWAASQSLLAAYGCLFFAEVGLR